MKLINFLLANHVPLDVKSYKVHLASPSNDTFLDATPEHMFDRVLGW